MTIQEAIIKAREGGYKNIIALMGSNVGNKVVLLDPLFWQALFGKDTVYFCPCCFEERKEGGDCEKCNNGILTDLKCRFRWLELIHHLAEGGTIETYFEKL